MQYRGLAAVIVKALIMTTTRHSLQHAKRFVVKIGSALLVDSTTGLIRSGWLRSLVSDLATARQNGQEVIIVSSGAIALGRGLLKLPAGKLKLEEKQAAAAAGQIMLAQHYQEAFAKHDIPAAQLLITTADTEDRRRHLNARATLAALLDLGAIPVINENDTIATSEIRFGDNDRLAARVAQMCSADTLVLLSDVDGLYSHDPRVNRDAEYLEHIPRITPQIEAMAGIAQTDVGTGGMTTKVAAAKIATAAGCHVLIGAGEHQNPMAQFMGDDSGQEHRFSWFEAVAEPSTARKRWLIGHVDVAGQLAIDAGAVKALKQGRSLLPAGVTRVIGRFERGDMVAILSPDGVEVARGLTAYSAKDAKRIAGHQSREIEGILGFAGREEMIHRDNLVMSG